MTEGKKITEFDTNLTLNLIRQRLVINKKEKSKKTVKNVYPFTMQSRNLTTPVDFTFESTVREEEQEGKDGPVSLPLLMCKIPICQT